MVSGKIKILRDLFFNFFQNKKYNLSYIIEPKTWSIAWDGRYITKSLNKLSLVKAKTTTTYFGLRNQIIHFGSVHTFLKENGFRRPHKSNQLILTWFHFVPGDKKNKNIIEGQKYLSFIHTSCNITKNKLIEYGVDPEKIRVIPLGVDLSLFKPVSYDKKKELKQQLGIPLDKIIIGSFQKDGVGWGKGLEPKLIKGPDVFVKTVEKLSVNYPIFVLLVGPARGYVQQELEKRNIPYKSFGYKDLMEISSYYQVLDLYIIASRIEGGPKQILEAWASKVPVVSTKVGMVPDISQDRENILLTEIENINGLVGQAREVLKNKELRERLIMNGFKRVQDYSWENTAQKYYKEIYSKLL